MVIEYRNGAENEIDMALAKAGSTGRNVWEFLKPDVFSGNRTPTVKTHSDDLERVVAAINCAANEFFKDARFGTVRDPMPFEDFDLQGKRRFKPQEIL